MSEPEERIIDNARIRAGRRLVESEWLNAKFMDDHDKRHFYRGAMSTYDAILKGYFDLGSPLIIDPDQKEPPNGPET